MNTSPVQARAQVQSSLRAVVCIGALSSGLQLFAAPPQLLELPLHLTPSEIEIYKGAQTLIAWTPRQVHECAFLRKLRPAESRDQLPMVLERVGQTVALQFHDFPRIACDEVVSEAQAVQGVSLTADGATLPEVSEAIVRRRLRYIVLPWPVGDVPAFEEYRTDVKGNPFDASNLSDLAMISSKYTSAFLYFSPVDQPDNRYRYFGIQTIRNRKCLVVGFAQEPETARRVNRFHFQGKTAGLLFQGLAWIDSESFQILRITTWLLAPRTDIGVSSQTSTIDFYPVQPSGSERVLWLPRDVTVALVYHGTKVRNTHRYSNFKLFRVESTIKAGP